MVFWNENKFWKKGYFEIEDCFWHVDISSKIRMKKQFCAYTVGLLSVSSIYDNVCIYYWFNLKTLTVLAKLLSNICLRYILSKFLCRCLWVWLYKYSLSMQHCAFSQLAYVSQQSLSATHEHTVPQWWTCQLSLHSRAWACTSAPVRLHPQTTWNFHFALTMATPCGQKEWLGQSGCIYICFANNWNKEDFFLVLVFFDKKQQDA